MTGDSVNSNERPLDEFPKIGPRAESEKSETEAKHLESAEREDEARSRELADLLPEVITECDSKGNLTFVNLNAFETFRYTREDFEKGINILQTVAPEDRDRARENLERIMRGEKLSANEYTLVRKDGSRFSALIHTNPVTRGNMRAGFRSIVVDITERKRAEEALLGSELKFRTVFECANDAIFLIKDHRVIDCNEKTLSMFGRTKEQVVGQTPYSFSTPLQPDGRDSEEKASERMDAVLTSGPQFFKWRHMKPDGTSFDAEISLNSIELSGDTIVQAIVRDITERKRSEEALRASRLQLSEAMDLAHIVYWESDPVTKTLVHNDPFYAFYGTTAEQEGGNRMTTQEYARRFVHPDDLPLFYEFVKRNFLGKGPEIVSDLEHRIIRCDGEVRHILARTRIVKDDSGRIVKIYGANQDITERKQMEKAVQESEEQFRRTFEGSPLGMVMAGADFRFIRANPAFCRMLGYTEGELLSLTFQDITHPEHIAGDMLHVNDLTSGKIPLYRTEKRYVRKDKGIVWGSSIVSVMRGADDRFLYFLTTVEDITQRRKSEEEKAGLESQLRQSQKMEAIGTLAGGIAHDFNNILMALVGYTALLRMKINDSTLKTYVDQIFSASHKAADLVQSLLAFSRQQAISLKPISIHRIITGTEKLLKRLVTEDISIKIVLAAEDITIMADASQIDQILFNLATNARDAMPQGGTLTIETRAVDLGDEFLHFHGYGEPGRYALLSVSDTGAGMDEATRERIFDPFFTTKEAGKGTGLGLSTVYGIVKQHNGFITVYSELNIGTAFCIYFPAVSEVAREERLLPAPVKGGNETILVAEDNETVRDLVVKLLTDYGYMTIEAVDGGDAIEQFRKADKIDLLILDSVMPIRNGREVYNEIRKIKPRIRVIFTSGYTRDIILDKGIEDEKFNFLQKPISPADLLRKVREVLDDRKDSH
jgi:PAS domain S-box-containing protein